MGPIYQVMGMYQVSVSRGNAQKQQRDLYRLQVLRYTGEYIFLVSRYL